MKDKKQFEKYLDSYVTAYLWYKEAIETENNDEGATEAVKYYMQASKELGDYIQEEFGEKEPELPRIDVFFQGNRYNAFAYRIYRAIGNSRQMPESSIWRNHTMCYIGECLEKKFKGGI